VFARRALILDPDNPMASHMARRMAELMAGRGEVPPDDPSAGAAATRDAALQPSRPGLLGRVLRRRR
jgi:hypothetical protein